MIEDSEFTSNQAYYGGGGALYADGHVNLTVTGSRLTEQMST